MRFLSFQKWTFVVVASLALGVAGCSPESSTPTSGGSKPSGEQNRSTTGASRLKKSLAEVPEPAPEEAGDKKPESVQDNKPVDETPADAKPNE
jgi:hypothetical protein